jgi:predicted transcriptional regulator of viral defense system
MKNTILSEKDVNSLSQAIVKYGRILDIKKLKSIFLTEYTASSAHNRINKLVRSGWLMRIKQGLYLIINNLSTREQNDISLMRIANALDGDSYISLAYALNYHQLFDQYSKTIMSVSKKTNKKYRFDGHLYKFSKIKKEMYFGFTEERDDGKMIKIAEAEKALIDYLYFDKSFAGASLVFEKLHDNYQMLDLDKLQDYAARAGTAISRKIGFLLDSASVDSAKLYKSLKNKKGFNRFTSESKLFNAKWRIYYDDRIIR